MPGNFYPPEGHDFVDTTAVRKLETENEAMQQANLLGRMTELRVRVGDMLCRADAMSESLGWAIYNVTEDSGEGGVVELNFHKEFLVAMHRVKIDVKGCTLFVPHVRLITNELASVNGGLQWITEEVTVDYENDCQYLLGVMDHANQAECDSVVPPLFFVHDGTLVLTSNYRVAFTPSPGVQDESTDAIVFPYGRYECLVDRIFALEKAEEIVASVAGLEPEYTLTKAQE